MEEKFSKLYENYLKMDKPSRVAYAKISASKLLQFFVNDAELNKEEAVILLFSLVRVFVSVDKLTKESECDLFNRVFGTKYTLEEFNKIVKEDVDEERIKSADNLIDALPNALKAEACILCLTFAASDGDISQKERELFEKIYDK